MKTPRSRNSINKPLSIL